jgi:hypothetical protein
MGVNLGERGEAGAVPPLLSRQAVRRALRRMSQEVTEFASMARVRQASERLTPTQRENVQAYSSAAAMRLSAARTLRWSGELPASVSAYREAVLLSTFALMASRDPDAATANLTPSAAIARLDETLATEGVAVPPELEEARPVIVTSDPLSADRLAIEDLDAKANSLEAVLRFLPTLLEVRSPAQITVIRTARLAVATAALCGLVSWGVRPGNVAVHKPARSSSADLDTAPWGAVDGDKMAAFGFHSQTEESPWLSIDLERPYAISSLKIFGRGDCCFDQSIPLALEISDDGTNYRKIAERTEPFSQDDPWVVEPGRPVARFVRLRTQRPSVLVLTEVEVYGRPSR